MPWAAQDPGKYGPPLEGWAHRRNGLENFCEGSLPFRLESQFFLRKPPRSGGGLTTIFSLRVPPSGWRSSTTIIFFAGPPNGVGRVPGPLPKGSRTLSKGTRLDYVWSKNHLGRVKGKKESSRRRRGGKIGILNGKGETPCKNFQGRYGDGPTPPAVDHICQGPARPSASHKTIESILR